MKTLKTSGKTGGGASRKAGGFTLIELMIAIAIVGILLSLAVPAYQDYTVRAKIADALNVAASMKVLIGEYYITEGELPATATAAGIDTNLTTDYVESIDYDTKKEGEGTSAFTVGILTLTLKSNIGGEAGDMKFALKAKPESNILEWTCGTKDVPAKKLPSKYLPSKCRTSSAVANPTPDEEASSE